MSRYTVTIEVGHVEADTPEEAQLLADELLSSLAESNDGSEVLAHAFPEIYLSE